MAGTFGQRLKALRENRNLLQKELADALGIDRSTITAYETDKRFPEPDILDRLADHFNVSLDFLRGRTDDPTPPRGTTGPTPQVAHRTDDYDELPEEARRELANYKEYLRQKYRKKYTPSSPPKPGR